MVVPVFDQCCELASKIVTKLEEGAQYVNHGDREGLSACILSLNELGETMARVLLNLPSTEVKELLIQLYECILQFVVSHEEKEVASSRDISSRLRRNSFTLVGGTGGRPSIALDLDVIRNLKNAGATLKEIAESFGVSRSTLHRRISSVELQPTLSNEALHDVIVEMKEEDESCGQPYISGELRARGFSVSRSRVRKQLRIVDPVGTVRRAKKVTLRRVYRVKGPNYLWHIDANEKLQPYKMYIHGAVDGFSRKILYLKIASNKESQTVTKEFQIAACQFGWPHRVRSDKGRENVGVARLMLHYRDPNSNPYITGRSVHNVRIERLWREVNRISKRFKVLFGNLEAVGALNLDNEEQVFYLHYIFIPQIQKSLNKFKARWNAHKIRTAHYRTPNALYMQGVKAADSNVEDISASPENDEADELPNGNRQVWQERAITSFPNPSNFDEYVSVHNFYTLCNYDSS